MNHLVSMSPGMFGLPRKEVHPTSGSLNNFSNSTPIKADP